MLTLEKWLPRPTLMNGLVAPERHISFNFNYSKGCILRILLHDDQILLVCIMDRGAH